MHKAIPRTLSAVIAFAVVALLTLPVGAASAIPIEGFPRYTPQSKCAPKPKPGTVKLANHLMARYPGTGSSGISRACSAGGVSEHKEGRAFDWSVNVHSKRDRGYAKNFLKRLFRSDKAGHSDALARRMGVMYIIWNDHIYSASTQYAKRNYLNASCKKVKKCSQTLRHRDHMHISLTWKGARAKTSWYTKSAPTKAKAAKHKKKAHKAGKKRATATAKATARRAAKATWHGVTARAKAKATVKAKASAKAKTRAKAKKLARAEAKAEAKQKAKAKAKAKAKRKAIAKAMRKARRASRQGTRDQASGQRSWDSVRDRVGDWDRADWERFRDRTRDWDRADWERWRDRTTG